MKAAYTTHLSSTFGKLTIAALAIMGAAGTAYADPPAPCDSGFSGTPTPNLADIQEITTLKSRYTFAVDATIADATKVGDLMDLFTDDICVDYGVYGRYRGKAAVRAFFGSSIRTLVAWSLHFAHDAVILTGGTNASAMWHFEARAVFKDSYAAGPITFFGHYEDQFVKTATGWKIRSLITLFETPPTGP
jgi:ketosteroid isomerase-like protein